MATNPSLSADPLPLSPEQIVNDENCTGWCDCPFCGSAAAWSLLRKIHICANDEECGMEFRAHNALKDEW